jgi:hypothetical protein
MKSAKLPRDFRNTSIFHGWMEYTVDGQAYRVETKGAGIYGVYRFRRGAFQFDGYIRASKTAAKSPRSFHAAYTKADWIDA